MRRALLLYLLEAADIAAAKFRRYRFIVAFASSFYLPRAVFAFSNLPVFISMPGQRFTASSKKFSPPHIYL